MTQVTGSQVLGAAAIVGAAVVLGSVVLAMSLNRVTQQLDRTAGRLDEIRGAVADAKGALSNLQVAGAAPARQPVEGDPNNRKTINLAGTPSLGPADAPVVIAEFSDFQ